MFFNLSRLENGNRVYEFDHAVDATDIANFFRTHPTTDLHVFEYGIDKIRLDLLKIRPERKFTDVTMRAFEFKSSRADFLSDKKWENYLEYCNSLTFVCPPEIIKKDELPKAIGLLYVFKYKRKLLDSGWKPKKERIELGGCWIRRPRRHHLHHVRKKRMIIAMLFKAKYRMGEIF